ncbi:hypothetical protein CY34DRAFT_16485 [Suillus luteus UH-Slu-Lm8-n1]|uniref:Uncharacterized protein n=1 Tax=Suillus luteus UH-Slu-Lm8-n1 TaxID=930992 RepID=A0A0D0AWM5_9AGAM|nr:hypothetical protein CY34DRAFT_16485 [Suillus luteus UH-Slu-Lm8-n1]
MPLDPDYDEDANLNEDEYDHVEAENMDNDAEESDKSPQCNNYRARSLLKHLH